MHVCFFTLGSLGDVQPYVALSKELIKSNHSATICTGGSFKNFIQQNGVNFVEIPSDLTALLNSDIGQKIFNEPLKNINLLLTTLKNTINPNYRKSLDIFYNTAKNCDLIIYHPKALGAVDIALKLNLPFISMPPVPMTVPIENFPNLAIFPTKNLGNKFNKLTYKLNKKAENSQIKIINDFRVNTLNLPKRKSGIYTFTVNNKEIPTLYPISKVILDIDIVKGFCFLESNETEISTEIKNFIGDTKPIVITFSSMPIIDNDKFILDVEKALEVTNNKAIILTGDNQINFNNKKILTLKSYPHDLLFKVAKCVIHHGGAGTTAIALKTGIPQIIIQFSVDQPFWAKKVYDLGCSSKPIDKNNIGKYLINALNEINSNTIIENCNEISKKILLENGNKNCVDFIVDIYNKNTT